MKPENAPQNEENLKENPTETNNEPANNCEDEMAQPANEENTENQEDTVNANEAGATEAEPTEEPSEQDKMIQKLGEAIAELQEQRGKYLLLAADFDNYRKRTLKEKTELIKNGGEKTITAILPILDDFERAIKNMNADDETIKALQDGVKLIYEKFIKILAQEGVSIIETKEQAFDTDFHEAIALIPAPSEELKGKILDCVLTGYKLNDKVIRHAKVVVGQ